MTATSYVPLAEPPVEKQRAIWAGNLTFWWVVGLAALWNFFWPRNYPIRSSYARRPYGPLMWIHLTGAFHITVACLWNVFHTPSHGPTYRFVHRWVGRVGMVWCVVEAVIGIPVVWWERWEPDSYGMAVGLTVLAIKQILHVVLGWRAIRRAKVVRDDDLEEFEQLVAEHKKQMLALFSSCVATAMFRVPMTLWLVPWNSSWIFLVLIPTTLMGRRLKLATDNQKFF